MALNGFTCFKAWFNDQVRKNHQLPTAVREVSCRVAWKILTPQQQKVWSEYAIALSEDRRKANVRDGPVPRATPADFSVGDFLQILDSSGRALTVALPPVLNEDNRYAGSAAGAAITRGAGPSSTLESRVTTPVQMNSHSHLEHQAASHPTITADHQFHPTPPTAYMTSPATSPPHDPLPMHTQHPAAPRPPLAGPSATPSRPDPLQYLHALTYFGHLPMPRTVEETQILINAQDRLLCHGFQVVPPGHSIPAGGYSHQFPANAPLIHLGTVQSGAEYHDDVKTEDAAGTPQRAGGEASVPRNVPLPAPDRKSVV